MIAPRATSHWIQPSSGFARLVALLLLLVGLQSGTFRDLGSVRQWVFGAANPVAAVMPESRKLAGLPADAEPWTAPGAFAATQIGSFARPASPAPRGGSLQASQLKYSTGPPGA